MRGEVRAGVVKPGDALLEAGLHRQLDLPAGIGVALRGRLRPTPVLERAAGEPDAVSRSRPIGRPAGSFRISPPAGFAVVARDVRQLHRLRVDEGGVAAGVRQHHRVVRRHLAQRIVERKALDVRLRHAAPLLLVPAAPENPLAGLRLLRRGRDHRDDLVPVLDVHQVERHLRLAEAHEVAVAFDQAGDRRAGRADRSPASSGRCTAGSRRCCRRRRCDRRGSAMACASGIAASTVTILPLRSTRVAGAGVC